MWGLCLAFVLQCSTYVLTIFAVISLRIRALVVLLYLCPFCRAIVSIWCFFLNCGAVIVHLLVILAYFLLDNTGEKEVTLKYEMGSF